jgi:hypothetical protein
LEFFFVCDYRVMTLAIALAAFSSDVQSAETIKPPQPSMLVTPMEPVIFSGPQSGSFYPTFAQYHVSATSGTIKYTINVPAWLTVPVRSGATDATRRTVTVLLNADAARRLSPGSYRVGVGFINLTNGKGTTVRPATLIVKPNNQ